MCGTYFFQWMGWGGGWLWGLLWLGLVLGGIYLIIRMLSGRWPGKPVSSEKYCPQCAGPVQEAFIRCPECGYWLKRNCSECKKIVKTEWNLCPYCETDLKTESVAV
jgi:RNA polymerase subunit RPABC4/transcription elongation factor Spt4